MNITNEIKKLELGESIIVNGKEFVKTKKGMLSTSGFKYTIKQIIEFSNR